MSLQLDLLPALGVAGALLALAVWVFGRVRADYRSRGALSRPIAALQTLYFCVYALSSYLFLDSRWGAIRASGGLLALAATLMAAGFSIVAGSMVPLGCRSFGRETGRLKTSGLYHYSRNPQLVGSFVFIVGYVLLWPAWSGLVWAALWIPICWLMVRGEEEHLLRVFGQEYADYCQRTPRTIGIPKRDRPGEGRDVT